MTSFTNSVGIASTLFLVTVRLSKSCVWTKTKVDRSD